MSVLAAKLIQLIYGDFYCSQQDKDKQKRPPRQEGVFSVAGKFGRLSPQGGDLVQILSDKKRYILEMKSTGSHVLFLLDQCMFFHLSDGYKKIQIPFHHQLL